MLAGLYAQQLEGVRQDFGERVGSGRASIDLGDVARAATFGAIDILLVDIDALMPGTVDEQSGVLALAKAAGPSRYDILDEIAGRAISSGAKVHAGPSRDIPGGGPVAAILR